MSKYAEEIALEHDLKARGTDMPKENAVEAIDAVVSLVRHAAIRNHPHSPRSCSPCEEIERILSE